MQKQSKNWPGVQYPLKFSEFTQQKTKVHVLPDNEQQLIEVKYVTDYFN